MKIAFVYDAVYPWIKGGAEKRIYEIGKRLAEKGHNVHVFGIKWWDGTDVIMYEGMVLHGVCLPMELYVNGRRSIAEAIIFSIKVFPHLIRDKFDIMDVSAFPYFSCFSAKLVSVIRRTPMVITWHEVWGDYWYEYLGKQGFFGTIVEVMVSKLSSRCIVVSEITKNNLESLGSSCKNVQIVQNGIDLKKIDGITPSIHKCDIIFIGRLIREKKIDLLIEAMIHVKKSLPEVECHIIGGGPEKERLYDLVIRHGLQDNIKFLGFLDHDEVISNIKSSKVLALPSIREGFGMVVIEAFGCGIPVVIVRHQGNAACELVDEGTGIIADQDPKELAKAFLKLILDNGQRTRMAFNSKQKAQGYDWDNIVELITNFYGR